MSFKPCFGLKHPTLQTIVAAKLPYLGKGNEFHEVIQLPDGDKLLIAISKPTNWRPHDRIVIILHGLAGNHQASYIRRIKLKLIDANYQTIAVNFRGCGLGKHLAKGLYHAGRSEDVRVVLDQVRRKYPFAPIYLLGYSLGGNVALKLASELDDNDSLLKGVIAITPPIDLIKSADKFSRPENMLFRYHFMRKLNAAIKERHQLFPEFGPAPIIPLNYGFWEFDECYTSKYSGFSNAMDYYSQNSTASRLNYIKTPCRLLFAEDDPFIDCSSVKNLSLPEHIKVLITQHGGHMGFLANPWKGLRWMDQKVIDWLEELSS